MLRMCVIVDSIKFAPITPLPTHTSWTSFEQSVAYDSTDTKSDGFTDVKRKKHKEKKVDMQPRLRQIEGIRLDKPKPNFHWQKKGTTRRGADMDTTAKNKGNQVEDQETRPKVSQLNEHVESDDEVDEFIFPEGDKFGDKFDIRLKGRRFLLRGILDSGVSI
ncbi:hypothetical protein Tco_0899358 [Tanacetum coccineum]